MTDDLKDRLRLIGCFANGDAPCTCVTGMEALNRIEELESKLAKAVEALQFYAWENQARLPSDGPWGAGSTDFGKIARTTLAEIKGESNE